MTKKIIDIVRDDAKDYSDNPEEYCEAVTQHGCVSGVCSGLIYYTDTIAFYDEHEEEIENILEEYRESLGYHHRMEAIANMTGASLIGSIEQEKNLLAWFSYEIQAGELLEELTNE